MQCECRKLRGGRCKHTIFSYASESDWFCGLCTDNYCSCRCPGCLEGAPDQPYGKGKAILMIRPSGFSGANSGRSEGWYPSVPEVDPLEPVVEGQVSLAWSARLRAPSRRKMRKVLSACRRSGNGVRRSISTASFEVIEVSWRGSLAIKPEGSTYLNRPATESEPPELRKQEDGRGRFCGRTPEYLVPEYLPRAPRGAGCTAR